MNSQRKTNKHQKSAHNKNIDQYKGLINTLGKPMYLCECLTWT